MAKTESTFLNMVLALFLVTLVTSTALGFIYELTKGPIKQAKLNKQNAAIKAVLPEYANKPFEERFRVAIPEEAGDSLEFYPGKNANEELVGMAVKTFTNEGFSGLIRIMVGFEPDGTIHNISVLEHKETPGLGDKMEKAKHDWSLQFNGLNPATDDINVTKDGGQVDAITAATITSRAFVDAVERAHKTFMASQE